MFAYGLAWIVDLLSPSLLECFNGLGNFTRFEEQELTAPFGRETKGFACVAKVIKSPEYTAVGSKGSSEERRCALWTSAPATQQAARCCDGRKGQIVAGRLAHLGCAIRLTALFDLYDVVPQPHSLERVYCLLERYFVIENCGYSSHDLLP